MAPKTLTDDDPDPPTDLDDFIRQRCPSESSDSLVVQVPNVLSVLPDESYGELVCLFRLTDAHRLEAARVLKPGGILREDIPPANGN